VDLDHCRNPETGEIAPWAQQLVNALHSYTEVSPSGTGVHIYVRGQLAEKGRKRGDIELYDRERYFTVTGDHLPETPTTIEDGQTMVEWLYVAMPIMATLLADSGRREKCSQLFAGDSRTYKSASEADLGLCSMAAHAGASPEQIDALMRLSGLYRAKWDEMHGAQTYGQMSIAKALEGIGDASGAQRPATVLDVVCLDAVQPERVDWLWKPYLPLGKLALLEGDPGTGKSTLTAMLAAHVTTGRPFPGEADPDREPRNVLFLQCEDGLADTALPRFLAVGADKTRVYALTTTVAIDDSRLGKAITECRPALVVIDPLQGYLQAKLDMHRANQSRAAMDCLRRLAETHKCAILCVRHFAKTTQEKSLYRGLGSIDFVAVVRSVLQVDQEGLNNHYILTHAKTNIGPRGKTLAYTIVPVAVPLADGGTVETSRIEWAEHTPTTGGLLSPTVRETVEALESLGGEGSLADIASRLGIPKPTAAERLKTAISTGVVVKETYGHYVLALKRDVESE
jgi:hypothetical protein